MAVNVFVKSEGVHAPTGKPHLLRPPAFVTQECTLEYQHGRESLQAVNFFNI